MITAHHVKTASNRHPSDGCDSQITLSYEQRFLRRKRLQSDDGEDFLVELAETVSVNEGDAFVLDDKRMIHICAAPEALYQIHHPNLSKLAWHIGNRHTPCQISDDHLLIQPDHVLHDLLIQLGATITPIKAAFIPEGGAYGHGRTHGHEHKHQHEHQHEHERERDE